MAQHLPKHFETIFKKGSKTYFNSSIFFPPSIRERVFRLYAFVRVADNFVDSIPQQKEGFYQFKERYLKARNGTPSGDEIIDSFVELSREMNFQDEWTDAFLRSMEADLFRSTYHTLEETLEYIYGSAEVIGYFMARIMELPEEAFPFAALLGKAMQYINFIRDIAEDVELGRTYLPLAESPFASLQKKDTQTNPEAFEAYIRKQIQRYYQWQNEAEKGFIFIPKRFLVPIKTASDMYKWTAKRIETHPWIVYEKKVKPPRWRIFFQIAVNFFTIPNHKKRG
jgi:phytoene synthase